VADQLWLMARIREEEDVNSFMKLQIADYTIRM